jgi:hypothetical protein
MAGDRSARRGSARKLQIVEDGARSTDELADLRQMLADAGAPEDLVRALEHTTDPERVMQQLAAAGVLPDPADALAQLIAGWQPLVARGVDSLSAEIAGFEFLAALRAADQDPRKLAPMVTELVVQAEEYGGAAALAMLRVLAVVGPDESRPAAAQAADRLVAAGLKDRPWVKGLGAPQLGACFGYTDGVGAQEAVAVAFRYGRREHAVAVLIDHDLGGGVKDCWPTSEPEAVRADYQRVARQLGLRYGEYEPAEARAILQRALDRPACPVQPDQVEDVSVYLELLRSRVALISGDVSSAAAARRRRASSARPAAGSTIHRVKITLRGSTPPIWRRLELPSGITLQQLHQVIQAAFGWEDYHMWVFEARSGRYGEPDRELGHRSAASKHLAEVAPRRGDRLRYTYDFGDNWEHDLVVEEVLSAEDGALYPRCVTGRRAAPPEDCGGIWGYEELVAVLADPGHDEHADRLEWLGLTTAAEFDPARFDLDETNRALSALPIGRTKR